MRKTNRSKLKSVSFLTNFCWKSKPWSKLNAIGSEQNHEFYKIGFHSVPETTVHSIKDHKIFKNLKNLKKNRETEKYWTFLLGGGVKRLPLGEEIEDVSLLGDGLGGDGDVSDEDPLFLRTELRCRARALHHYPSLELYRLRRWKRRTGFRRGRGEEGRIFPAVGVWPPLPFLCSKGAEARGCHLALPGLNGAEAHFFPSSLRRC